VSALGCGAALVFCVTNRLACVRSRRDSGNNLAGQPTAAPRDPHSGGRRCACSISRSVGDCPELGFTHGHEPPMQTDQPPPRSFLCARCRSAVTICSHCDRGQRYCSAACSRQARSCAQRAAAKRYQNSRKGRHAHARRQGQWRARKRIVTHQGSPPPPCADVLPTDEAIAQQTGANQSCQCHFCGRSVSVFVRLGFLGYRFRHPSNRTLRSADLNDHYP